MHPRHGTPWVSIVICGVIFSIFSLQAFQTLVVIDVLLNTLVLLCAFFALWKLRITKPSLPRKSVPGGYFGLVLVTLGPLAIITLAVVSQVVEEGWESILLSLAAMAIGALLFIPMKLFVKPGVPDVNPYESDEDNEITTP